jgi:hypothetical protein
LNDLIDLFGNMSKLASCFGRPENKAGATRKYITRETKEVGRVMGMGSSAPPQPICPSLLISTCDSERAITTYQALEGFINLPVLIDDLLMLGQGWQNLESFFLESVTIDRHQLLGLLKRHERLNMI